MKKRTLEEQREYMKRYRGGKDVTPSEKPVTPGCNTHGNVTPERIELTAELRKELGVQFKEEDGPFILDGIPKIDQIRKLAFLIHKKNGTQMRINGKTFNGGVSELEAIA